MRPTRKPVAGAKGVRKEGRAIVRLRTVHRIPELKPGQVRCHVCRNRTTLKGGGFYRKHRTLTGDQCYAVRPPGSMEPIELPPVLHRGEPVTSNLDPERAPAGPARRESKGVRTHGYCETCDAPVSGERRFCGKCAARRMGQRNR